ncbi:MAG: radical SAM protein, partial [Clostridia bacterium]|nr:radical SAM protein [Clostridia bacterium]
FITAFNHLLTFPGTKTYDDFKKDNRLLTEKWWLQEGYKFGTISFEPKHLNPEELKYYCKLYKKKFFTFGSIFKRGITLFKRTKNVIINLAFWIMNILFHFEVDKRSGIPVGENLEE